MSENDVAQLKSLNKKKGKAEKVEKCYCCLREIDNKKGFKLIETFCGHKFHLKCFEKVLKY